MTVGHFWLMVWEQQSKAILMLNKIIEKKQMKCHPYWPSKDGQKLELHDVRLTVEFLTAENYKNFSKRLFRITDTESTKSREVIQFHYTQVSHWTAVTSRVQHNFNDCSVLFSLFSGQISAFRVRRLRFCSSWSRFGMQACSMKMLDLLSSTARNISASIQSCERSLSIFYRAGIGRSGTFCLVDCCLVLIDKEGENRVSVQKVLLELRKYRMGLIQTHDQLTFSYEAIIEGMKRMNNDVSWKFVFL